MKPFGITVIAGLALVGSAPFCLAKNDIRGVATAQPLRDALETLELDGAQCAAPVPDVPTVCTYDERTRMTVYSASVAPNKIEKVVYTFYFKDLAKMRGKLQLLYGLRPGHIEGEHKLFTGERLDIELDQDGSGSLSIVNDAEIKKNQAPKAR